MRYFNFPIHLIQGLIDQPRTILDNIFDYALVKHANTLEGNQLTRFKASAKHYGVTVGSETRSIQNGSKLILHEPAPMTGLSVERWFDFYSNHKTEFELAQLAMFLGVKSIIGKDAAKKTNKAMIVARMLGYCSHKEITADNELYSLYFKRYHFDRSIIQLELSYGLKTFSDHCRGLYVSFQLDYEQLAKINIEAKHSSKLKQLQHLKNQAKEKAKKNVTDKLLTSVTANGDDLDF